MVYAELASEPFFEGIDASTLEDVSAKMRPRRFAAREFICRQGEPGNSLFVIQSGVAQVVMEEHGRLRPLVRLRRGDVIGEMSMVSGEPRSASVVASVATDVLELDRDAFATVLGRHPALLANLSRILTRRLAHTSAQAGRRRGEAVALLTAGSTQHLVADVIAATKSASPHSVTALHVAVETPESSHGFRLDHALAVLDDLLSSHATVVLAGPFATENLRLLLDHMDRVVLLFGAAEVEAASAAVADFGERVELVLVSAESPSPAGKGPRVKATIDPDQPRRGVAWLGRHLARTKLGLALGAGGAKGYAHVGALQVLEKAGYTVDCVAGTSCGALVGAWLASGMRLIDIEATMRSTFTPENVAEMFTLTLAGTSRGAELFRQMCRDTIGDRTFLDLAIPFVAMAVDLNTRQPAAIAEGLLWEALVASTAVPGMFPPYERSGQRLVDGLALVPVPTSSLTDAGADVTVSVNLMSRDTLPAWPGGDMIISSPVRKTTRMLDTLLEVMDLAQLDASVRHAALADVVITPRFGPSTWRDYHMADLFLAAGREAATEQLASLRERAKPQSA